MARRRPTPAPTPPRTRPSRINRGKILDNLRAAARKGDRSALQLALAEMRTLAHSPRYWEKYLTLLGNPLARLVDLLAIKQGERIAHLKGWKKVGGRRRPRSAPADGARGQSARSRDRQQSRRHRAATSATSATQPSLF